MKTKVIVIIGPTAVGKTSLSIEIAKRFNGEIISGDSQQVYKKLDIGTAKITPEEQEGIPHYLIDVREVSEAYSAFDFVKEAETAIKTIVAKGKIPIIVGGTGLYIQSLLEGYHLGGSASREDILAYRSELDTLTDEELFSTIAKLGLTIPQMNRRRAMRTLEIAHLGKDLENKQSDYDALLICLDDAREVLYERINQRVDLASKGIGYKELFPYFAGELTLEEATDKIKQHTRRFAKRQLTWFRNRMNAAFYQVSKPKDKERMMQDIKEFMND